MANAGKPMLTLLLLTGLATPRVLFGATPPEQPTPVTLHLRDIPAAEAYAQLAKQSKVRIDYSWRPPDAKRRVTLTLVHEPFWQAMARVGKAGGMEIDGLRRRPELGLALV